MFIRVKRIKDKPYAYLVQNKWKDGMTRQRVKQYLGRVHKVKERPSPVIDANKRPKDILNELIEQEVPESYKVSYTKRSVKKGKRDVVLQLNGGYLCSYTLKELHNAFKHPDADDHPGLRLAEAFSQAGLRVPKDCFVRVYLEAKK